MPSKAIDNPYALLTDDLVEKALCKEFGSNVHLESYKVIDFTKKGDNFASTVTSIQVNYELAGTKDQISYIVKLNHSLVTEEFVVQFLRFGFIRETIVLGPILDKINYILDGLNEQPLKAPRCLSNCDDFGKEVLLAEDLRTDGFIMVDKMKGMDFKHANFVVKELGRFHACSILYENQLKGSTFEKSFPSFDDPFYKDQDCPYIDEYSKLLRGQLQLCIDLLNSFQESESINKWWNNLKNVCGSIWFRCLDVVSEKFNVLVHGDCWNNNFLFRYDHHGEPIDFRIVDFQRTVRSSPATDLTYFFYTSLTGETREKNKTKLLVEYYLSFSKVLLLAHQPVPFSFTELEEEFQIRMVYGLVCAMLNLPTALVRPEDALDIQDMMDESSSVTKEKRRKYLNFAKSNLSLKTRFLTMFDDMTKVGIFERTRTIYNPYKLLTEELVEEAVQNDVGKHAQLKAFEVRNFTNKGDNYVSTVIAIKVLYDEDSVTKDKTYVVKLNPQREYTPLAGFYESCYQKEIIMLSTISEGMNTELLKLEQPEIKVPKLFSFRKEVSKEILILENLKPEGFVMFDRRKGMDVNHCLLVMEELGRLHASGILFEEALNRPINEEFSEEFAEEWAAPDNIAAKSLNEMIGSNFDSIIDLLSGQSGYDKVIRWINGIKDTAGTIFLPPFDPDNKKFNVLSHGDCKNNNIMFKYDEANHPIEIRLVDLQASRKVSAACDLNYFFYSTTTGDVRKKHKEQLLIQYYLSVSKILLLAEHSIPFSLEELKGEVHKNMIYGCVTGMSLLPFVLSDPEDTVPFDDATSENMEAVLEDQQKLFREMASKSDNFTSRFLSMFDEMIEHGIIT